MSHQDFPRRALSSNDYPTDSWILDIFSPALWFDPCPLGALNNPSKPDGLEVRWWNKRRIYCNPPYSEPHLWVDKALNELFEANMNGRKYTCVMLLKHDSSTQWFRKLHEAGAYFLLVSGRLSFQTGTPCAFPSLIAVISNIEVFE